MTDNNARAYKEIYEILNIFPKELVDEIPEEKIIFFRDNMDNDYKYDVTIETFDGITMLEETKAILTILFRDYWATDKQREQIQAFEDTERIKIEEDLKTKYNPANMFKQNNKDKVLNHQDVKDNINDIVQYKESNFKKIINKILHVIGLK